MYGLPRCHCGGTVYNDDTGLCDDCTNERIRQEDADHITELQTLIHEHVRLATALEHLAALADRAYPPGPFQTPGPVGRFRVVTAAELRRGDRLFDPPVAVTVYHWVDDATLAVAHPDGSSCTFHHSRPVLIWRPDDPFARCPSCSQPIQRGCDASCRSDEIRQAHVDAARASMSEAPERRSRAALITPFFDGVNVDVCSVVPRPQPAAPVARHPGVDAAFERLRPAFAQAGVRADLDDFDLDPANLRFGTFDSGWDLTIAAAILLATETIEHWRLDSTLLWAQVGPDGTLTAPAEATAAIAAYASGAGYERLVAAADFAQAQEPDLDLVRLSTLREFLDWAGRA